MPPSSSVDDKSMPAAGRSGEQVQTALKDIEARRGETFVRHDMTAFVESCLETVADSAVAAERKSRGRPRARKLLHALQNKTNILVTTHLHPDPDALGSSMAMVELLRAKLPNAKVSMSIKGNVGGGINAGFAKLSELKLVPWDDDKLNEYDAILLLDTQPLSASSPLPKTSTPPP